GPQGRTPSRRQRVPVQINVACCPLKTRVKKSVRQLSEPALGVGRAELRGLLVPGAGFCGLGNDVAHVRGAEHIGIVGLREEQRGAQVLRFGGTLEQQSRGGEIAGIEKALGALHQRRKLVRVHARDRGRGGRRRRNDRNRRHGGQERRGRLRRRGWSSCLRGCRGCGGLQRGLIGRRYFLARRQHRDLLLRDCIGAGGLIGGIRRARGILQLNVAPRELLRGGVGLRSGGRNRKHGRDRRLGADQNIAH